MEVFAVLASVQSMGLTGIQGYPVTVEAYCVDGMPMFEIVGLPDAAVKEAIRKASGKNERAIMALLDVDGLKASKNQTQDIDAALAAVKKDNDYLFGSSAPVPRVVSSTSGINNDAQTKREQANEALRNLFGKGE